MLKSLILVLLSGKVKVSFSVSRCFCQSVGYEQYHTQYGRHIVWVSRGRGSRRLNTGKQLTDVDCICYFSNNSCTPNIYWCLHILSILPCLYKTILSTTLHPTITVQTILSVLQSTLYCVFWYSLWHIYWLFLIFGTYFKFSNLSHTLKLFTLTSWFLLLTSWPSF